MELMTKQGFKQTELGLIPEDWNLVPFDEVFRFYSTSNYSKAQMSEDDEVGCIHYGLIHAIPNTQYNLKDGIKYYVTSQKAKYEFVQDGDVIMVDASEDIEGINKSVEVFGIGNKKYISGLHTYLLRDKKLLLADNFRGIILNSQFVKNQMLQLAVGMKVFGVSKTQLVKVKLVLPPTLTEQKAIATALSDVDALISSLDKLITKKKAIKQGAMQELLTGKTRVKGFEGTGKFKQTEVGLIPEDWDTSQLGRLLEFGSGRDYKHLGMGDIPVYGTGGIMTYVKGFLFEGDSVGIGRKGTIDCPVFLTGKFWTVDTLFYTHSFVNTTPLFIYYKFLMIRWKEYNEASGVPSLNKNTLEKISITLPSTITEQNAIAQILSDMDIELEQLVTKKSKYQSIKQGMMQELLTGKTRLV